MYFNFTENISGGSITALPNSENVEDVLYIQGSREQKAIARFLFRGQLLNSFLALKCQSFNNYTKQPEIREFVVLVIYRVVLFFYHADICILHSLVWIMCILYLYIYSKIPSIEMINDHCQKETIANVPK